MAESKGLFGSIGDYMGDLFKDTSSGASTYNQWVPKAGGGMEQRAFSAGDYSSPTNGGNWWDTIMGGVDTATQFGKDNQGLLSGLTGGAKVYTDYQSMKNRQDYSKGLLDLQRQQVGLTEAERQRQISKEEQAQAGFSGEYGESGLFGVKKKKEVPSYYGV